MLVSVYDFSDDWFTVHIPLFDRFLSDLKDRPCRLLEIGSYEGRSATWLIDNIASHQSSSVELIDSWEHPKLQPNLRATGHPEKAKLHLGQSALALRALPFDSYDFIYIDGSHATLNTLEDAVLSFRLLKAGGIMAFDDYLWNDPKLNRDGRPKEAIDAFMSIYAGKIELLHGGYQVWVRKRPSLSASANRPWRRPRRHPRIFWFQFCQRLIRHKTPRR